MGSTGGWNRPTSNQPTGKKGGVKAPSAMKGVVAGLVTVCALGGLCLWMFSGGENAPKSKPEKERGRIKEVTPSASRKSVADTSTVRSPVTKPIEVRGGEQSIGDQSVVETNETTTATNKPKKVKRVFKSQMEMFLNMAIPTHPGERMPPVPLPGNDDDDDETKIESVKAELADIEKGFKNELKIKEDDSDALAERKAIVTDAKAEFRELMKEGMTLKEYVNALQDKFNADADLLSNAQKMVDENYADKSLSDADYAKAKEKVDALLKERGLPATKDESDLEAEEAARQEAAQQSEERK